MKGKRQKLKKSGFANGGLGIVSVVRSRFAISHSLGKNIFWMCLIIPCYFLLLGAFQPDGRSNSPVAPFPPPIPPSDLDEQMNIPLNNGTQGELRDEADRLVRFGGQSQRQGNLDKAIPYWLQAIKIYHQIGDVEAAGRIYDFVGLAYTELGDYRRAEDALRRRLGFAREIKDVQGQIFALNNVGTVLLKRGSLPAARTTFDEALAIARRVNNEAGIGLTLNNLGLVADGEGDYNRAIVLYEEALIYRNRAGDPIGQANTLNNLGDAYFAKDPQAPFGSRSFRDTIGAYGSALQIAQSALDRPNQYRATDALVKIYCDIKLYSRAIDLLDRRLAIARSEENPRQELAGLQTLAQIHELAGNYEEALRVYHRAIDVARTLRDTQTEATLSGQVLDLPRGSK